MRRLGLWTGPLLVLAGVVQAAHASLVTDYTFQSFDENAYFGSPSTTRLYSINDKGQIAGTNYGRLGGAVGFLLSGPNYDVTYILPPLVIPPNGISTAYTINNAGQVSGYYLIRPDPYPIPFQGTYVRNPDGSFTLNQGAGDPGPPGGPIGVYPGWDVPGALPGSTEIFGTNSRGQIVGAYSLPFPFQHQTLGFLGTPVPEPASLLLAGLGAAAGIAVSRWRRPRRVPG